MRVIIRLVTVAILVLLAISNLYLPSNPEATVWTSPLVLLLIMLAFALLAHSLAYQIDTNKAFTLGIVLVATLIAIMAARPVEKSLNDAIAFNQLRDSSVAEVLKLTKAAEQGDISVSDAEQMLEASVPPSERNFAKRAFTDLIKTPTAEAAQDVFPKVSLTQDQWSCNSDGCGYLGQAAVFTLSTTQQLYATLLMIGIVGLLQLVYRRQYA